MKLTRNKIRKIRKQVHQSVRKWKKGRNSNRRRVATFRRSPPDMIVKRKNVFNKTLKKYIPLQVLEYLKDKYLSMRRLRRKQRRMKNMTGGDKTAEEKAAEEKAAAEAKAAEEKAAEEKAAAEAKAAAAPADPTAAPADVTSAEPAATAPAPAADATAPAADATAPAADATAPDAAATAPDAAAASAAAAAAAAAAVASASVVSTSASKDEKDDAGTENTTGEKGAKGTKSAESAEDTTGEKGAQSAEDTTGEKGAEGAEGGDDKKKSVSFNLGKEVPGDITIHTETFDFDGSVKSKKDLLKFLVDKALPYYVELDVKGKPLNKRDSTIFEVNRILYGIYVTDDIYKKGGDKQKLYFSPGSEIGIADGESISSKTENTETVIFTGEKVTFDPKSKENAIKLISGKGTPNEKSYVVTDSDRLYKLTEGGEPSSIDSMEDVRTLGGDAIESNEFRLQIIPLSNDALKKSVAESSGSGGDKKKKRRAADDSNSYVFNIKKETKIMAIQTLRKSLEVVRVNLEEQEDELTKTDANGIFQLLIDLLNNPEFAKNDGFDDFKESVFGFNYMIPGEQRKYGFTQMMTFFEQKEQDIPKLVKDNFVMLLTLLGHGPGGADGACVAFNTNKSVKVEKYITTLANGDIVTTEKLGSDVNIEGFGDQLDKINDTNKPKEEEGETKAEGGEGGDAKKAEGTDGDGANKAEGSEGEGAKAKAEGVDGDVAKNAEGVKDANKNAASAAAIASAAPASAPSPAPSEANKNAASAAAIASAAVAAASAASAKPDPATTMTLNDIPKEPIPTPEEVKAINELYNDDKINRKSKIEMILGLKKYFNPKLKKIFTLLKDILDKSIASKSNSTNKTNKYITEPEGKGKLVELEGEIKNLKKNPDYNVIDDFPDKITSKLKISKFFKSDKEKQLLAKIDSLFRLYKKSWDTFDDAYEYFNDNKEMADTLLTGKSAIEIRQRFQTASKNMDIYIKELEKDASDTVMLEELLSAPVN